MRRTRGTTPAPTGRRGAALLTALVTGLVGALAGPVAPAAADLAPQAAADRIPEATGAFLGAGGPGAVTDRWIVTLRDSAVGGPAGDRHATVAGTADRLARRYGVTPDQVWGDALNGFSVRMPEAAARRLAADPAVVSVEQDRTTRLASTQLNPPWGLDRIDAPLGLDNSYSWISAGSGVKAYIVDSGVQIGHVDFGGQAIYGYDAVDGSAPATDCVGHGTHAAGTVGGTAYGMAKNVTLVAVKVFDCAQPSTISILIAGINWMVANHVPGQPAVANIGVITSRNAALEAAVANAVADGITVTVPAGNSNADACNVSPAVVPTALTVGATTTTDARATFSNYGPCLDIFAPGVNIVSDWWTSSTAATPLSGTSQAAPHVAGAAARVLSVNPTWTPAQVASYLSGVANPVVTGAGPGSPNRLLHLSPLF